MTREEFLRQLDDLFELEAGTLTGDEPLNTFQAWDSMTVLGFIALLDEHFSLSVPTSAIMQAETVNGLIELVKERLN